MAKTSLDFCKICSKPKTAKDFYRVSKTSTRLRNVCIECWAKERTKPKNRKAQIKWLYSIHARFLNSKTEAKHTKRLWTLSEEQYSIVAIQRCHYCNRLSATTGSGLDRIDNNRGYELGNVLPCCGECNRLRSNVYTVEETRAMVQALLKFRVEKDIQQSILVGKYYL
jgi:hypothetical protein